MCRVTSCCGCMSLRQGTIGAAIYTMFLGTLHLVVYCVIFHKVFKDPDQHNATATTGVVILGISLAFIIFWIISGILLYIGVNKKNRSLMCPWLIVTGILIAIHIMSLVITSANKAVTGRILGAEIIVKFFIEVVVIALNIYAMVVVSSFRKTLLEEIPV